LYTVTLSLCLLLKLNDDDDETCVHGPCSQSTFLTMLYLTRPLNTGRVQTPVHTTRIHGP